ncbi:DUF983 domain-containing protein [Capnocytophaga sp. ARDL2]|uniref:DUF983 domain-containing protein n=1 Tax=Capnocytophaga sp. ARDL2 TaxID=3238809 RepID=UPI003558C1D7
MSYISKVVKGTCPHCGKSKVFKSIGNILTLSLPKMHENCPNCNYSFHRETGFYFGAMYMSYAWTVAEMVACFVLGYLFHVDWRITFAAVVVVLILLANFNFRVSRLMWLNMFYKEDEA